MVKTLNGTTNSENTRIDIRKHIREQRETLATKWKTLQEQLNLEEKQRTEFHQNRMKQSTKVLPLNIKKFIGTIKKSVHHTMRTVGGTPGSIIRNLFSYWDSNKSGMISASELLACMKSLSVKVTLNECREIVAFYSQNGVEMDYKELLQDIEIGEPSITEFVDLQEQQNQEVSYPRFEELSDSYVRKPAIVVKFIEAVQHYISNKTRSEGGTPHQHILFLFQFYDYDFSGGLTPSEIQIACKRRMNLSMSMEQAQEIVNYYDRKRVGEMGVDKFITDVCEGVQSITHFVEVTPRKIAIAKASIESNPFIPKPFQAPKNRVLEKFKQDMCACLARKVQTNGGTFASWVRDAFVHWDPHFTKKISHFEDLRSAASTIGVQINEEEAKSLMKSYDRYNTGEMHYMHLAEEILREDSHFLQHNIVPVKSKNRKNQLDLANNTKPETVTTTSRSPNSVRSCLQIIKDATQAFHLKSKGNLNEKDILHGTFVRFDATKCGRIDLDGLKTVLMELKAKTNKLSDTDLRSTMVWFDSDGSGLLDYNSLTSQLFGESITTEKLKIPNLKTRPLSANGRLNSLEHTNPSTEYQTMTADFRRASTHFGVSSETKKLNLNPIEPPSVTLSRLKIQRNKILAERKKIQNKISLIDEERNKVLEEFKARHHSNKVTMKAHP
eukprot:gene7813-10612_t